jgi:hypothetical protein
LATAAVKYVSFITYTCSNALCRNISAGHHF